MKVDKSLFSIIELNEKLFQSEEKRGKLSNDYNQLNQRYEQLLMNNNKDTISSNNQCLSID